MIKVKISSEYGYNRVIKDDHYVEQEKQTINAETGETETVTERVLVKGDYSLVDETDLAQIGKTKKFVFPAPTDDTYPVVNMTPQEITEKEGHRAAWKQKQLDAEQERKAVADDEAAMERFNQTFIQIHGFGRKITQQKYDEEKAAAQQAHNRQRVRQGKGVIEYD